MLVLTRDVPRSECRWLHRDLAAGEVVYRYKGVTYGCCGDGIPVTEKESETPFFEVPRDAVAPHSK